jgi:hypothetical protein
MPTACTPKLFEFEAVEHRAAVAGSDGRDNSTRRGWMSTPEKKCINDDGKKAVCTKNLIRHGRRERTG